MFKDRVGIVPGTIGDMIINSQQKMRQQQPRSPLGMRRRPVADQSVRTTVDFKSSPPIRRGMR